MKNTSGQINTNAFPLPRLAMTGMVLAAILVALPALQAQRGGGAGGGGSRGRASQGDSKLNEQDDSDSACPGIAGNHKLMKKMASSYKLTCEQEERIQPLLHAEELVSIPLLSFSAFTPEEQQEMMLQVRLATMKQIRPLLNTVQQKKSDAEAESLAASGGKSGKGEKKTERRRPDLAPWTPLPQKRRLAMPCCAIKRSRAISRRTCCWW